MSNVHAISRRTQHRECKRVSAGECRYFTYNDVNLVTTIEYPGGVANYFWYDAMMRRYAMQDSSGLRYFTWDQNGMNLLAERDAAGAVTAYYTHGFAAVDGIGSPVAVKQNRFGAAYFQYPGYDHKGNLTVVTDENGNQVAKYNYTANGVTLTSEVTGGISETRLGYQANWIRLQDAPFDMYLSPTRVEVPAYRVFLGRDPKNGLGGDYTYCSSEPVSNVDPDGEAETSAPSTNPKKSKVPKPRPPKPNVRPKRTPQEFTFELTLEHSGKTLIVTMRPVRSRDIFKRPVPPPTPAPAPTPSPEAKKPGESCEFCGPDITKWFEETIAYNLRYVKKWFSMSPQLLTSAEQTVAWKNLVKRGARWDFKLPLLKMLKTPVGGCPSQKCAKTVTLAGSCVQFEAISNIHFGVVGRAARFWEKTLLFGAGVAQVATERKISRTKAIPIALTLPLYGDEPEDVEAIKIGFDMANGMKLKDALAKRVAKLKSVPAECKPCKSTSKPSVRQVTGKPSTK